METTTHISSSTAHSHLSEVHGHEHEHHQSFFSKYIFSLDHKTIGKQYLITAIFMAIVGMSLSLLMRAQLGWPGEQFSFIGKLLGKFAEGGIIKPEYYYALVTLHGTIMVFFVLTGGLSGTFFNILIPLQIGTRDMASPLLNALSYWFFFASSCVMLSSFFVMTGPASGGWTIYPPLSALPQATPGSGTGMTLWLVSMSLFIASGLMGGINYISTVINMRTKGMSLWKMPLTVWSFFITAILGVLSFPVLFSGAIMLVFDRSFGTSFFLPDGLVVADKLLNHSGGSPILWQHLFWFLGHPEVYIVLLPAMGMVSEILSVNARKPIFGYKAMVFAIMAIGFLSFIVWAHHMFQSGMNPFLGSVFVFTTLLIAIPSAVKTFNWLTTLYRSNIIFTPAMLYALGFVSLFITGGITGIFLGNAAVDIQLHDTYFVVAHFHLVMGAASFFGLFAGVYHWFPKMFGRMMNNTLGKWHFWLTVISLYCVFFPMHYMGMAGVPRRYYAFTEYEWTSMFLDLNRFISIWAFIGGAAQGLLIFNFFWSMFKGKPATANPWKANTLEWTTPIKPGHGNWPGEIPTVHRWPYDYSKPGHEEDYIPQHIPYSETGSSNTKGDY